MKNKVIFITGGASGLGQILTETFAAQGAKVAFTWRSSKEAAAQLQSRYGAQVLPLQADATNWEQANASVNQAVTCFGKLDVLVNNASSARHFTLVDLSPEDFDFSLKSVLYPVFNYCKAAAPYMMEQQRGKIINIGSINGMRGREGSAAYCAGKAAIEGFTKTIAKELGEYNICCNVVAPGFIHTESQKSTSALVKKLVLDECAIRHLTTPDEIADLVLFLSSDKASTMTGQVFQIDCGQYI